MSRLQIKDLECIEKYVTPYIFAYKCPVCKTEIREILSQGPNPSTAKRFCMNCEIQVWAICDCNANLRYDMAVCQSCGVNNPIYFCDPNKIDTWIDDEKVGRR